jgi:HEAT repeat protein
MSPLPSIEFIYVTLSRVLQGTLGLLHSILVCVSVSAAACHASATLHVVTCLCCLASAAAQVALVNGVPKTLSFRECLQHFLDFRVDVVQRRAAHALAKATARLHLVEGLLLALQQLDAIVQVCV